MRRYICPNDKLNCQRTNEQNLGNEDFRDILAEVKRKRVKFEMSSLFPCKKEKKGNSRLRPGEAEPEKLLSIRVNPLDAMSYIFQRVPTKDARQFSPRS